MAVVEPIGKLQADETAEKWFASDRTIPESQIFRSRIFDFVNFTSQRMLVPSLHQLSEIRTIFPGTEPHIIFELTDFSSDSGPYDIGQGEKA